MKKKMIDGIERIIESDPFVFVNEIDFDLSNEHSRIWIVANRLLKGNEGVTPFESDFMN